jgi:uncharacterized DUF497 family protein
MAFEFDPKKSEANKKKHGVDFFEIQELWGDPLHVIIPARVEDEPRWLVMYNTKVWSCVVTYRSRNICIISGRRARKEEVKIYESKNI